MVFFNGIVRIISRRSRAEERVKVG